MAPDAVAAAWKRVAFMTAALFCMTGVAIAENQPGLAQSPSAENDIVCRADDWKKRYDAERSCIERLGGRAQRVGPFLQIGLLNGDTKTFTGDLDACDFDHLEGCNDYRLAAYFPSLKAFAIEIGSRTDADLPEYPVLLVSEETGAVSELRTWPEFSRSRRRLVSVAASDMYKSMNGIDIWAATPDGFNLEFSYRVPAAVYESWRFVSWEGDDRILLRLTTNVGNDGTTAVGNLEGRAEFAAGGWKLIKPEAPR
jgi:hypothetical protein